MRYFCRTWGGNFAQAAITRLLGGCLFVQLLGLNVNQGECVEKMAGIERLRKTSTLSHGSPFPIRVLG